MRLETERVILRPWRAEDLPALAAIHADPEVMVWLGSAPLAREASDAYARAAQAHIEAHGYGIWAVERRQDARLIGAVGLRRFEFDDHPMTPSVEIAWRQDRATWGQGYIAEAARAALADGFDRVGLPEIRSWTAQSNLRSQAVMQRIGLERVETLDFDHPRLAVDHPLSRHVVYRAFGSKRAA